MRLDAGGHRGVRWLLLRGIGLVYVCAFASLVVQIAGLIGDRGILPAGEYLDAVFAQIGWRGLWYVPTLGWLASGTAFLQALAGLGVVAAALVVAVRFTRPALMVCWLCYLSLVGVGQAFLSFQWDILLLEAGFLAIFLAPAGWRPRSARDEPAPLAFVWLFRLLLFRLMFSSGVVKILSGDAAWRDLTALSYHYETQPLPTPLAWYAHQLPGAVHRATTGGMFAIELLVPFLYFAPRWPRFAAAGLTVLLQALIAATGNYGFFNLLTVILCIALLDDDLLRRVLPAAARRWALGGGSTPGDDACERAAGTSGLLSLPPWKGVAAGLVLVLGLTQLAGLPAGIDSLPSPLSWLYRTVSPLRLVNGYGLFAVMTRTRPEIVIEGSADGDTWRAYEFRYKVQDPGVAPPWVAPHMPRLDWQMWFAALGGPGQSRWFFRLVERLLQNAPAVTGLLRGNPFPDEPPRYVRATLYRYRFTDAGGPHADDWWSRERIGTYLRPVSASDFRRARRDMPGAAVSADTTAGAVPGE